MGINGSTYSDAAFSATKAHDGYLYISSSGTGKGNLAIGTTNATGKVNFVVGGLETANIVGYVDVNGIWSPSINSVVSANAASANSIVNTRISANVATIRGEISGNVSTLNGSITSNISTQNTFTQAAYNKANNALANTNGVLTTGDFYISGDGYVNGTFVLANSTFGATEAALTIKATATVQPLSQSGTMMHVTGKANTPARIIYDSFSTDGSAYSLVAGRSARGTVASPTATQNNDILMRIAGNGWGTTGFAPLGVGRIDFVATENYSDTNRGSKIVFYNVANGSNTVQEIATFNADAVTFDGTVYPAKGFIYDPREFAAAQTAVTIDFANDVVLKANCAADITFSFSNYTAGKQVEVWLTNTSGLSRTVTHGCSAVNSTKNSTTFTLASTSTAWLKYYCVNGDLANTFVTVVNS
jgi:hypothetical protein